MTPANLDLEIRRGVDFSAVIACADSTGAAVDLTGYTAYAQARRVGPNGSTYFDLAPAISDAAEGEITIAFTAAETDALSEADYGWDLILEDGSGVRTGPWVGGNVRVSTGFTRVS